MRLWFLEEKAAHAVPIEVSAELIAWCVDMDRHIGLTRLFGILQVSPSMPLRAKTSATFTSALAVSRLLPG